MRRHWSPQLYITWQPFFQSLIHVLPGKKKTQWLSAPAGEEGSRWCFLSFFLHWCFLWNTSTEFNQARSRVSINSQEMNKSISQGFPGDPVVKNPPCNARDPGSTPGPRRFHMLWSSWACGPQLQSPCSGAHELQLLKSTRLEPMLHNKRSHRSEKPLHRNRRVVPARRN